MCFPTSAKLAFFDLHLEVVAILRKWEVGSFRDSCDDAVLILEMRRIDTVPHSPSHVKSSTSFRLCVTFWNL